MTARFTLTIDRDSDGSAELFGSAANEVFAGAGSAYFSQRELVQFGSQLKDSYPLGRRHRLAGGFWNDDRTLKQVHLSIDVYPVGTTGTVGIHVALATPVHDFSRADERCSVELELLSDHEGLRQLGEGLVALASGYVESVTIETAAG